MSHKGIEPSDEFKKKMKTGSMKVKVKVKGKINPSRLASLLGGMKKT